MSPGRDNPRDRQEGITAAAVVEYMGRLGVRPEQLLHGTTVIGDFIGPAYSRLVEITGAQATTPVPSAKEAARATLGDLPLTLVSMRMGAPAAAMVMEEYAALGAHNFLFIGAAGSLQPSAPIGSLVVPTEAIISEGTSRHYGVQGSTVPCPSLHLVERLVEACRRRGAEPHIGRHWTTDDPYRELVGDIRRYREAGVLSVDMEVSTLFSVARFRGLETAAVLAISDEVHGPWNPGFTRKAFLEALNTAADAALEAAQG